MEDRKSKLAIFHSRSSILRIIRLRDVEDTNGADAHGGNPQLFIPFESSP